MGLWLLIVVAVAEILDLQVPTCTLARWPVDLQSLLCMVLFSSVRYVVPLNSKNKSTIRQQCKQYNPSKIYRCSRRRLGVIQSDAT